MREDFLASVLLAAAVFCGGFLGATLANHVGHVTVVAQAQPAAQVIP
jgi:hypothetical protein